MFRPCKIWIYASIVMSNQINREIPAPGGANNAALGVAMIQSKYWKNTAFMGVAIPIAVFPPVLKATQAAAVDDAEITTGQQHFPVF